MDCNHLGMRTEESRASMNSYMVTSQGDLLKCLGGVKDSTPVEVARGLAMNVGTVGDLRKAQGLPYPLRLQVPRDHSRYPEVPVRVEQPDK
jgi:hypothetical protein